jgi:lipoate synthase
VSSCETYQAVFTLELSETQNSLFHVLTTFNQLNITIVAISFDQQISSNSHSTITAEFMIPSKIDYISKQLAAIGVTIISTSMS